MTLVCMPQHLHMVQIRFQHNMQSCCRGPKGPGFSQLYRKQNIKIQPAQKLSSDMYGASCRNRVEIGWKDHVKMARWLEWKLQRCGFSPCGCLCTCMLYVGFSVRDQLLTCNHESLWDRNVVPLITF